MENHHPIILDLLSKATSQNPGLIKIAEQQLKCLEIEKGFYPQLMAVVLDRSLDVNVRWVAAVYLKNGIDRYWRKAAPNAIPSEEKAVLKQKFLLSFDEPMNLVATQMAVIISKVSRLDWPGDWLELFPTMISVIQRPEDLYQQRGFLVLYHVVKILASKRLVGDQQIFQQMASSLFPSVMHLWANYSTTFLQEAKNNYSSHKLLLEKCLFSLKVLRKLVVYGFKQPSKNPDVVNFISVIFQQFKPFIECRKLMLSQRSLLETCEKYLVLLVKVLWGVLEQHASSFVQFIRPTLESAVIFCFAQEYKDAMFERLTVGLLNLIKAILTNEMYRFAECRDDARKIRKDFFTAPVLNEILQQLVSRYFLLTAEEIQTWEENPEEFAIDEQGESWKFNLRPCTEVLFLSLFREYADLSKPFLMEMIKSIEQSKATDFASMLKREAVFNAIGLLSFDLYNHIDFDKWYRDILIPELRIKENNYYIVQRRVIWLIGEWVSVMLSCELRPLLYEVLLEALSDKQNLLVRLAAANALKSMVDHLEFEVDQFLPFVEGYFAQLFSLLRECQECELKMASLHMITFLIERIGKSVHLEVDSLIQYLHNLWEKCGDHMMLRCAIVSCFKELVWSLGSASERLHSILLPMIAFSTDISLPGHIYLLDDGLSLWQALVENTPTITPDLLDVAQNVLSLFECGRDAFEKGSDIIQGYIHLSPKEFLERYGENIVKTFSYVMTDIIPEACTIIMDVVNIVLVVYPVEGSVLFKPVIAFALTIALQNEERPYILGIHFSVLSRVIIHNQNCFGSLLQEKALECNEEVDKIFAYLLEVWLKTMPAMTLPGHKKLSGLALSCLLTSDSSIVHYNICGVLLAIVEVLNDITKVYADKSVSNDILIMGDDNDDDYETTIEYTEHEKRKSKLQHQDPVHTVVLRDYLKSQLSALEQSVGHTKFEDLMSTVDVETMQQLQAHLQN